MTRAALPNFSKGEIAPELYGRIDTGQYNSALKRARNFVVQKYGGVTFRPGTKVVGKWDDPTLPVRFVPFQFSIDQAYVLVMGQGIMRPVAGGFVAEQNTQIIGVVTGASTRLTIPYHGYAAGDRIYLSGIEGTVELNGQFGTVTSVPDADTVIVDIDSRGYGAFVSSDGTLNAAPPAVPPAPPVVPPVVNPPAEPEVGSGYGYDYNWGYDEGLNIP